MKNTKKNKKNLRTKRYRRKQHKTKKYRKKNTTNKKGGMYGVRPRPSGAVHRGTEIPHYHFQVLMPSGSTIDLGTSFGITHTLEETNDRFYSDYVANILQTIEDKTRNNNVTLFWKGKMLLPSMKLRRISVDGNFINLSESAGEMYFTTKKTSELTIEDFNNVADGYSPEEGSIEYRDKPDTPREVKGERISGFDDQAIAEFTEKIEERKRQLGI